MAFMVSSQPTAKRSWAGGAVSQLPDSPGSTACFFVTFSNLSGADSRAQLQTFILDVIVEMNMEARIGTTLTYGKVLLNR
jgi:hypothetical protein